MAVTLGPWEQGRNAFAPPLRPDRPFAALPFRALEGARGHLLPLGVVMQGIGIGLWFAYPAEPERLHYAAALAVLLVGAALAFGCHHTAFGLAPAAGLAAMLAAGFLLAGARAHLVAAPVLAHRYYGPVEGRVVEVDRSASDAIRVTLDRVVLSGTAPEETPAKVRLALRSPLHFLAPAPGQRVMLTGHLAPPAGPSEPGGFDFRRMAHFDRLGAVGYGTGPLMLLEEPGRFEAMIGRLRMALSARIRTAIPGEAGAFAAGALTGDRSGISRATVEALRDSSLAHILAISGMNLALLCGFVFALLRGAVALVPPLALRVNAKKVAALLALAVALFYLLLSGGNVATERAFLMLAVVMGAVLTDRRAITLRSAALAAGLQLMLRPEALLEPGFQMSFAATIGLVTGFRGLERLWRGRDWPFGALPLLSLLASTVIGGLASAPFVAAHFNRFADYGLIANLLTVPVMGLVLMPMGALAVLLAPLGLSAAPLWLIGKGAEWVLFVAHRTAAMEGAVTAIPAPPGWVLALLALGLLWLILWPGRARSLGAAAAMAALLAWGVAPRPVLLIAENGALLGLRTEEGRALSSRSARGLTAAEWLENDGDLAGPAAAGRRPGFAGPAGARRFRLGALEGLHLNGRNARAGLAAACATADLVIIAARVAEGERPADCPLVDQGLLAHTGALAVSDGAEGFVVVTANRGRIWEHARERDREEFSAFLRRRLPEGIHLR